jgi:hypothetical protein
MPLHHHRFSRQAGEGTGGIGAFRTSAGTAISPESKILASGEEYENLRPSSLGYAVASPLPLPNIDH